MGIFDFVKDAGAKIFGGDEEEEAKVDQPEPINYARQAYLKQQAELAEKQAELAEETAKSLALRELLSRNEYDISQMDLQFDDGIVTLTGAVDTQANLEGIILMIGNSAGVAQVDAQVEVLNPEPEAVFYTVQKGDTLSKIAKEHYGKSSRYPEIFEANKPMLKDPNKIYPGQVLRIPQDSDAVA